MGRCLGTVVRGIRTPIIMEGDDLQTIVVDSVLQACREEGFSLRDKDVVSVTEAVVGRAQGNYATIDDIAADVRRQVPGGALGLVFPILSRNRFSILLKAFSMGVEKLYIQLSYPSDEMGNHLVSYDALDEKGIDPYVDVLTEERFRELFGEDLAHEFTGIDYVQLYKEMAPNCTILFANDPRAVLQYVDTVMVCDIHTRKRTRRRLEEAGAKVIGMEDVLSAPLNGSGFNPDYGVLGSNKASETRIKLFPRDCDQFVQGVQQQLLERTGKRVEVMVYGDGAFKDPVGKIWELADPVVSPGHTEGLKGTPHEVKLKYIADMEFGHLHGKEAQEAIVDYIKKANEQAGISQEQSQGTTPRQITDLIGSLCDLTSGSGDKGTPVVLVQGYFDNYAIS